MRLRAVGVAWAAAALVAGTGVRAAPAAPLAQRLSEVASGYCPDILSRKVPVPAAASPIYAEYGLVEGIPPEAMTALKPDGLSLIAQATLASGTASDGAFVVALGGSAGETCRLIVYKAPAGGALDGQMAARLQGAAWRMMPPPPPVAAVRRQAFFTRVAGQPYLAKLLTPVAAGPVAMVITVAAIPPTVTLPQGY
jgi:hypothetical protein